MLLREDFYTHIYPELIGAIERNLPKLEEAIKAAQTQAKGYLSRYDITALFAATGDSRDPYLLLLLKDLASWHFVLLANPSIHLELIRTRYEDAIRTLERIQAGKHVPPDWPNTTPDTLATFFHVTSQKRRNTGY